MSDLPVIIIGAGVSGLILAQHLKKQKIPFKIFERDVSFTTRGVGWGLTLHWSMDALRSLLPEDLVQRLPSAYADRVSFENGLSTRAPYFDLSTGDTVATAPSKPQKIRVTRQRFRLLLSTGIDINWGMCFKGYRDEGDRVIVNLEDGTEVAGRLLVGCDGANSRIRRAIHPEQSKCYSLPMRMLGVKIHSTPEECEAIRAMDPFFFSATSSKNDTFLYFSVLDAPGSNEESSDKYVIQACISWPSKSGFWGKDEPLEFPSTHEGKHSLFQEIISTWADPFKSFLERLPKDTEIQALEVQDFIPPPGFKANGRVTLMGDSVHAMAMYRGEGANHAIYDVFDFSEKVTTLLKENSSLTALREGLDKFENIVALRARPAVMASRRACLDAHDWSRIDPEKSPLFMKRGPWIEFDEAQMK